MPSLMGKPSSETVTWPTCQAAFTWEDLTLSQLTKVQGASFPSNCLTCRRASEQPDLLERPAARRCPPWLVSTSNSISLVFSTWAFNEAIVSEREVGEKRQRLLSVQDVCLTFVDPSQLCYRLPGPTHKTIPNRNTQF